MGTSEKPKRRRGWRWLVIVAALLVLAMVGAVLSLMPERVGPDAMKVREILNASSTNRGGAYRDLFEMGPRAYPEMRKWIEYKESSIHERLRTNWWKKLPDFVKSRMENPTVTRNRHITAVMITGEMGPMLARPLMSSLCKVGMDPDWITTGAAMQSLYWSVPESAVAKKRIAEWVGDVGHLAFAFGSSQQTSDEMWTKLPEMAPLHVRALRCTVSAAQSAYALGAMGTNAAMAIPALIEVCDMGYASPQIPARAGQFVGPGGLWTNGPAQGSRPPAYQALGKIGIATPEVLAALKRGLADTNYQVQMAAWNAWRSLRQPSDTNLTATVTADPHETVKTSANTQWEEAFGKDGREFVQWVGTLGNDGREFVPQLTKFTSLEYNAKLLDTNTQQIGFATAVSPAEALRVNAIVLICQIAPEEIPKYLPDLVSLIALRTNVVEFLQSSKGQAAEIVPALEPDLRGTNISRALIAAYIISGVSPGNEEAMKMLRDGLTRGTLNDRMAAGLYLWKRTGECGELLKLCVEGLNTPYRAPLPGTFPTTPQGTPLVIIRAEYYTAVLALQELGPAVRPIIPELKKAAMSPNQVIRNNTALILYKYAPEELPPVK